MHHWTYSDHVVLPEPVPLPDGGKQSLYWYLDDETRRMVILSVSRAGVVNKDEAFAACSDDFL